MAGASVSKIEKAPAAEPPKTLIEAIGNGLREGMAGEMPCGCQHCNGVLATIAKHVRAFQRTNPASIESEEG